MQQADRDAAIVQAVLRSSFVEASAKVAEEDSLDDAEPIMERFLQFARDQPTERAFLVRLFIDSFSSIPGGWQLIQFCMHELRWYEIREYCRVRRAGAVNQDERWFWDGMLDSFNDGWKDADLFKRYRKG